MNATQTSDIKYLVKRYRDLTSAYCASQAERDAVLMRCDEIEQKLASMDIKLVRFAGIIMADVFVPRRLSDEEYKQMFVQLESVFAITESTLDTLSALADERMVRVHEVNFGKRSSRSAQNRRFINLMNALESSFHISLEQAAIGEKYEVK